LTFRIFRNSLLVGVGALLACTALFLSIMYGYSERLVFKELAGEAQCISAGLEGMGDSYLDKLQTASRITIIKSDGTVVFDNVADASQMENHSNREEIREALADGVGQSIHFSRTLLEKTLYYAVKLDDGRVLRISATQDSVFSLLFDAALPFIGSVILVLALSGLFASRLAKSITKPINSLDPENPEKFSVYSELEPLVNRLREQKRTIRKQLDELSRSQREFAAITENMSEGFILIDNKRQILSGNKSGLDAIGTDGSGRTKTISRSWCRIELCGAVDVALTGERRETLLSGDEQTVQVIASPVVSNGQINGAVLLIMDVTEREQRETLRREFTANVSHELKTPLTSISGFAELMKEGIVPPDKVKEFAADIYTESRRLIALVDDIIKLSRLDENTPQPEREEVDLYELSDDILENIRPAAEKRSIKLSLDGEHIKIKGVWRILNEVVFNLCDNAIKYNRDGGEVKIRLERTATEIKLSVSDTGIGIPYVLQSRIFERFYRVDKSHSRGVSGTGLGLSIVKHGAQYHGARVELESEPGKGSKFTVIFPG
jgi:Signal transduction histidine kinase